MGAWWVLVGVGRLMRGVKGCYMMVGYAGVVGGREGGCIGRRAHLLGFCLCQLALRS